MTFEFGDVVAVAFPFTDQSASKRRPAVVISTLAYNKAKPDIILAAITSRIAHADEPGDFVLSDWEAAGLLEAIRREARRGHVRQATVQEQAWIFEFGRPGCLATGGPVDVW